MILEVSGNVSGKETFQKEGSTFIKMTYKELKVLMRKEVILVKIQNFDHHGIKCNGWLKLMDQPWDF